jgi:hypothetical protein
VIDSVDFVPAVEAEVTSTNEYLKQLLTALNEVLENLAMIQNRNPQRAVSPVTMPCCFPSRSRRSFGLIFIAALMVGWAIPNQAFAVLTGGLLDQSFVPPPSWSAYSVGSPSPGFFVEQAQTFQVGIPGNLTGIDVQAGRFGSSAHLITSGLVLSIKNVTASGFPGNSILATATLPPSAVPLEPAAQVSWVSFDLSASPIPVQVGDKLAITLTSTTPANGTMGYGWMGGGSAGGYPVGNGYGHTIGFSWNVHTFDFGFQTYVTPVPEPGTAGSLLLGFGMLAVFRKTLARQA